MEVTDPADLVGPLAAVELAGASVLFQAEPLVLRLDRPVADEIAAAGGRQPAPGPDRHRGGRRPRSGPAVLADAADVCLTGVEDPPAPWVCADPGDVIAAVASQPRRLARAGMRCSGPANALDVWSAIAAESATYALLLGSEGHHAWLAARGPAAPAPTAPGAGRWSAPSAPAPSCASRSTGPRRATRSTPGSAMRSTRRWPWRPPTPASRRSTCWAPDRTSAPAATSASSAPPPIPAPPTPCASPAHPGRSAHRVADRLHAHLHGHCIGAGIEVPAFAHRISAHPDTRIALPELGIGLVPGAGGTVSLPRRIGRQRTAWLALTGATLSADDALAWGLVDEIATDGPRSACDR